MCETCRNAIDRLTHKMSGKRSFSEQIPFSVFILWTHTIFQQNPVCYGISPYIYMFSCFHAFYVSFIILKLMCQSLGFVQYILCVHRVHRSHSIFLCPFILNWSQAVVLISIHVFCLHEWKFVVFPLFSLCLSRVAKRGELKFLIFSKWFLFHTHTSRICLFSTNLMCVCLFYLIFFYRKGRMIITNPINTRFSANRHHA